MLKLTTPAGVFGPYSTVTALADRYRCDGADLPFTVVGNGVIADVEDGDFPVPQPATKTREELKAERAAAVDAITVTTQAGNTFDGDEVSQTRMARAIIALSTGLAPSANWVLADNSVIAATTAELTEALVLAGMAQAAIWAIAP